MGCRKEGLQSSRLATLGPSAWWDEVFGLSYRSSAPLWSARKHSITCIDRRDRSPAQLPCMLESAIVVTWPCHEFCKAHMCAFPIHIPLYYLWYNPWHLTFIPHSALLTPHSSLLTLHFSLLIPHSALLTPHSSLCTFHPSLPTLHFSLLTPHSALLTPHYGSRERHCAFSFPHTHTFTFMFSFPFVFKYAIMFTFSPVTFLTLLRTSFEFFSSHLPHIRSWEWHCAFSFLFYVLNYAFTFPSRSYSVSVHIHIHVYIHYSRFLHIRSS